MPKNVVEVLKDLAAKAGIAADDANLTALLGTQGLTEIQVADEVVNSLNTGLLSIEAAKNNHPDIKKKYFADAFDGIDKLLLSQVEKDTFDDAELSEIKAEKSTSKKLEIIVSKLKEKRTAADPADKAKINQQLEAAHAAARVANEEKEKIKKEYEEKIKIIHTKSAVRSMLGGYKTVYDDLPPGVRDAAIEALIEKSLQDKQAMLVADENGQLQLRTKDGNNVFGSNHVQLTPQSFLDQTFAPILKVSGPAPASQQQRQTQPPPAATTPPTGDGAAQASSIRSHNEDVLAALGKPAASLM